MTDVLEPLGDLNCSRGSKGAAAVRRVSRDVAPSAVSDLVDNPPRATVAYVDADAVDLVPVNACLSAGLHLFGVADPTCPDLDNREVVLVIDDGAYWFELRGLSLRGVATRVPPPTADDAELAWYSIRPRRVLAWDYGTIHEA